MQKKEVIVDEFKFGLIFGLFGGIMGNLFVVATFQIAAEGTFYSQSGAMALISVIVVGIVAYVLWPFKKHGN